MTDLIHDIYRAVGDEGRWKRLASRLAGGVTGEIAQHLAVARRAHDEHLRLAREVAALSAVHDQLALGALLVDGDGKIIRGNAVGLRLLNEASGVVADEGRVRAVDPDEHALLRTAIADTTCGRRRATPFVVIRRPDHAPLSVFVVRPDTAVWRFFDDAPAALLLLVDPDLARLAGPQVLRTLFGFTAREAECAALLMRGLTIAKVALALGVTRATARTFLAHMADKTDSHTQSELVVRLLAIPDLLTEP